MLDDYLMNTAIFVKDSNRFLKTYIFLTNSKIIYFLKNLVFYDRDQRIRNLSTDSTRTIKSTLKAIPLIYGTMQCKMFIVFNNDRSI